MDAIHSARQIFDSSPYPYQLQSIAIFQNLREFFNKKPNNSTAFWNCPSSAKWIHHSNINKETKKFNLVPILSCKLSWDFSKKRSMMS